jgi:transcriptional regulator with XRE-family HTH domain
MPRRGRRSRSEAVLAGRRHAQDAVALLGGKVRTARLRRGWSQRLLGERVGLCSTRISQIERGLGTGLPIPLWFALAAALGLALKVEFGRDPAIEPTDAGHLGMQELMLRLGRETGRVRNFELPTRSADPSLSVDVGWRDDACRVLILNECWNTFGSINASIRSTRKKMAEAEALAAAIGGDDGPYRVAACWSVRDTKANRELLARYPEIFATAFTGSSLAWVRALTTPGASPPTELGLVWMNSSCTRLVAWRRR